MQRGWFWSGPGLYTYHCIVFTTLIPPQMLADLYLLELLALTAGQVVGYNHQALLCCGIATTAIAKETCLIFREPDRYIRKDIGLRKNLNLSKPTQA